MRRVLRTITVASSRPSSGWFPPAPCKALCLRKFAILPERLDHRVRRFVHAGSIRLLWSVPIPSHDVLLQDPFDFGDGCRICY